jgi:hypothetical protein
MECNLKSINMKKLLPILGVAILMTACNRLPEQKMDAVQSTQQNASQTDTIGMAAFNAWKAQNELASVNAYQQTQQQQALPEKTRTIVKYVPVANTTKSKPAASNTNSTPSSSSSSSTSTEPSSSGTSADAGSGTGTGTEETAKAEKKEGWSKAAKGAVIGGVAGAAGGAILNKKNRVVGAVIGGVVGAAGGYGVGRTMDKKDGRIEYSTIIN